MMEYLISMFIDNELSVDDKVTFVEKVHSDKAFKDESIELLNQEKIILSQVVDRVPPVEIKMRRRFVYPILRPMGLFASALAAAILVLFLFLPAKQDVPTPYRFVIYRPDVSQAQITGSFTEWRVIPLKRKGASGYWEITFNLPKGEHRFTYILNGNQRFADPTILTRENDDFGDENTILIVRS
jgi:hypothetical protein